MTLFSYESKAKKSIFIIISVITITEPSITLSPIQMWCDDIYESAFENCIRLTTLSIPSGITQLETNCFKNCSLNEIIFTSGS